MLSLHDFPTLHRCLKAPTNTIHFHLLEMVETCLDDRQSNSSRRILAELQLRINGFNTYG